VSGGSRRRSAYSSNVGRASHRVPPRTNVLRMKIAAILRAALRKMRGDEGLDCGDVVVP
jgi:hypothetical protein